MFPYCCPVAGDEVLLDVVWTGSATVRNAITRMVAEVCKDALNQFCSGWPHLTGAGNILGLLGVFVFSDP